MNRLKNSEATRSAKSFGDSIKKHIFHKSIISRTPKRSSAATPVGIETPNFSNNKQPKLRVLFQSPAPSSGAASAAATPELLPGKASTLPVSSVTNTHPLQKSISSSSLLLNSSVRHSHIHHHSTTKQQTDESETLLSCSSSTHSNDCLPQQQPTKLGCSVSAPVSRQISSDLHSTGTTPPKSSTLNTSNSSSLSSSSIASSQNFQVLDPNCCVTPLKLISEAAKQLIIGGGVIGEKKSVAWDDYERLDIDENSEPCTSFQQNSSINELKSRYKSEPNLSCIFKDKQLNIPGTVPEQQYTSTFKVTASSTGRSFTRKLIKGVSMGNLKFPFSTPESTKRLVRTVSSTLKRRHSDDSKTTTSHTYNDSTQIMKLPLLEHDHNSLDDLDDENFEDDPNDNLGSDSEIGSNHNETDETLESTVDVQTGISSNSSDMPDNAGGICERIIAQATGLYRHIDLLTSTPSLLLGRRSMSPITKSAQRMPKSMQESIMTPRSRKPVMVLTTTLGSSDPNQTVYQNDLSRFREQDEESYANPPIIHTEDAFSVGSYTDLMNKKTKLSARDVPVDTEDSPEEYGTDDVQKMGNSKPDVLSANFKQYLRSRSVLTDSPPVDSSFSSHPDDFGDDDDDTDNDSTREIVDLNESQLSPSLLYCLDGNEPIEPDIDVDVDVDGDDKTNSKFSENSNENLSTPSTHTFARSHISRRDMQNPFCSINNVRKRAASNDITKLALSPTKQNVNETNQAQSSNNADKENQVCVDDYLSSKKILISEFPNETSF